VRATSEDRIERIALVVSEGMTAGEQTAERQRRILALLTDLFDTDILVLAALGRFPVQLETAPVRTMGWFDNASREEREEHIEMQAIEEHRLQRLISLGLVERRSELRMTRPLSGAPQPEMRTDPPTLSRLGRVLLRKLGYERLPAERQQSQLGTA